MFSLHRLLEPDLLFDGKLYNLVHNKSFAYVLHQKEPQPTGYVDQTYRQ